MQGRSVDSPLDDALMEQPVDFGSVEVISGLEELRVSTAQPTNGDASPPIADPTCATGVARADHASPKMHVIDAATLFERLQTAADEFDAPKLEALL